MHCVDLNNDTLKILGSHMSYNKKLKEDKIFYTIVKYNKQVPKIWKMRNLTLEAKIFIFKALAISSKTDFQSLITTVPRYIVNQLAKIQKAFSYKVLSLEKA